MDIPLLGGGAEGSWFENKCPLRGCASPDVANFIVNQPIYELCTGAVRKRGLPVQPFWWDQPIRSGKVWQQFRGTRFNLRRHFLIQHPQGLMCILIEGSLPLPQCAGCGLQTPVEDLSQGHHHTGLCQRGWERKCQHAVAVRSQQALNHTFTVYG
jgi:hypothetical protein